MKLGLDELMIVNPAPGGLGAGEGEAAADAKSSGRYFLGADGSLYEVQELEPGALSGPGDSVGGFFLGDDGTLYQVVPERPR